MSKKTKTEDELGMEDSPYAQKVVTSLKEQKRYTQLAILLCILTLMVSIGCITYVVKTMKKSELVFVLDSNRNIITGTTKKAKAGNPIEVACATWGSHVIFQRSASGSTIDNEDVGKELFGSEAWQAVMKYANSTKDRIMEYRMQEKLEIFSKRALKSGDQTVVIIEGKVTGTGVQGSDSSRRPLIEEKDFILRVWLTRSPRIDYDRPYPYIISRWDLKFKE
jgi:hypothetical protein